MACGWDGWQRVQPWRFFRGPTFSPEAEQASALVGEEGEEPGEGAHVGPLEEGPFPGVGLAADDGDGADALEGEDVEDHQGDGDEGRIDGRAVGVALGLEFLGEAAGGGVGFVEVADVVHDGHGADEDFARGEGGDDADAHFPIESEWGDGGFDEASEAAGEAVAEFGALFLAVDEFEFFADGGFDGNQPLTRLIEAVGKRKGPVQVRIEKNDMRVQLGRSAGSVE